MVASQYCYWTVDTPILAGADTHDEPPSKPASPCTPRPRARIPRCGARSIGVLLTWMAGDTGLAGGSGFGEFLTGNFPATYSGGELTAYGVVNLVTTSTVSSSRIRT